jgi:hypothetical protein
LVFSPDFPERRRVAMMPSLLTVSSLFGTSLAAAERSLDWEEEVLEVYAWVQSWSSTACGHPGVGGHALTSGLVVVVVTSANRVLVFSQGRLLHSRPLGEEERAWISNHNIPERVR